MQKIIDTLPDVQSFELHPKLDRERINQKFLELIEEHKQSVWEKIQNTNIPKLIPVVWSFEILYNTLKNGWHYCNYLGETSYEIFWNLIIILWFTHLFSSLASLEITRLWIPIWNYWKCFLRNSDNTIEFHVSGISEIPQHQMFEKITQDVVDLCLQYQTLKECNFDTIELKTYLLWPKKVQANFLKILSKKLAENNIQIQEDFIQNLWQHDLEWYKKIMLMWKADWLKNTDRYFEKSSNFFIRMFQIKWWFNFFTNLVKIVWSTIKGVVAYSFPMNHEQKKMKTRLQKTTHLNIDLHKISHKNNT